MRLGTRIYNVFSEKIDGYKIDSPIFYNSIDELLNAILFFDQILNFSQHNVPYIKYGKVIGFQPNQCFVRSVEIMKGNIFTHIYTSLNGVSHDNLYNTYKCSDEYLLNNIAICNHSN